MLPEGVSVIIMDIEEGRTNCATMAGSFIESAETAFIVKK